MKYILSLLLFLSFQHLYARETDKALVKIFVTQQEYDYSQPWQRSSPFKSSGSGVIIDSNRILTCAHVVEFGEFIEVRKARDSRKYSARVRYVSPEYDLAILEVDDDRFFNRSAAIALGDLPNVGERVTAMGFPTGGDDLSITSGIVSRIENVDYSYGDYNNLGIQIDAAINPGNSGGPVLQDDVLVGIAFQGRSQSQSIGYMIPMPVIRTFLNDIKDGQYDGPAPMLAKWQRMENPSLRDCYGLSDTSSGVLINRIHPCSALTGLLQEGDILMAIDSIPIQDDGSVMMAPNLKTSYETIIQLKNLRDSVFLKVLRNGTEQVVKGRILFSRANVRLVDKVDLQPRYYIEDGFVFTVPSYYYFKDDPYWAYKNPKLSAYYYGKTWNTEQKEEIVMLASVLPDKSNVGYHDISNRIIKSVNGRPIHNFNDLIAVFSERKDDYYVVEDDEGMKIIIDNRTLDADNEAIIKRFGIPAKMRL